MVKFGTLFLFVVDSALDTRSLLLQGVLQMTLFLQVILSFHVLVTAPHLAPSGLEELISHSGVLYSLLHHCKESLYCIFLEQTCISFIGLVLTKYHRLCGLKQLKFIVSQFQWVEVPNLGIGRAILPLKCVKENPSLPLSSSWWSAGSRWHSLSRSRSSSISASIII